MTQVKPYHARWFPKSSLEEATIYSESYPVPLRDGSVLQLPLRALPGGEMAIALLMSNQTSFAVEHEIIRLLTDLVHDLAPEAIVGVPTMGLAYARPVAQNIGLDDYVALGHSCKFWYDEEFSEPLVSSTSPLHNKRLYLDPALVERVQGRRAVIVDDVINTGQTAGAAVRLLRKAGADIVGVVAPLTEGWAWYKALSEIGPDLPALVQAIGHIPMFRLAGQGWSPIEGTCTNDRPSSLNG
ncbi:phosphoribosyltransferase [Gluconobacter cerinus]|uniref:phosphoribosyltransferase n=1 Tax=Gluconobacter cerinus TaxID=38307 RepID=UPI001B8DA64C|nr:phosphoribosyltransferase [Gluconobacter cerinus]MBS1040313.1 phosphoribosyltransferase [Gluconobacter cerinus]MBS1046720.1 phosphoribosyltransferase [Gluconobacter cerinus]